MIGMSLPYISLIIFCVFPGSQVVFLVLLYISVIYVTTHRLRAVVFTQY